MLNRRTFLKALPVSALASHALAKDGLRLHIGHTGLTWIPLGGGPSPGPAPAANPMVDTQYVEAAIRDIADLGYYGIELFGNQIEAMEAHGGLKPLLDKYNLPLISAYCGANLSDPARRKDSITKTITWAGLVKKCGGTVIVVGPNGVKRSTYDFKAHKDDIVATLNELGKAVMDVGLTPFSTNTRAPASRRGKKPMLSWNRSTRV